MGAGLEEGPERVHYGISTNEEKMKIIQLSAGYNTMVSDEDFDWLSRHKWSAEKMRGGKVYAVRVDKGKRIKMHRFILDAPSGIEVDHKNGNSLDNQRDNLRLATHHQNSMNVPKKNRGRSRFKGVSWRADRKTWVAHINFKQKQIYLGSFHNEITAAAAYNEAAKEWYGEWAYLNPI